MAAPSAPSPDPTWGACRFCGVAVPPEALKCEICGAGDPIRAADLSHVSRRQRRRLQATGVFRSLLVVGAAVALALSLISVVLSGPPSVADPLSTSGSYTLGAGNSTTISGEITGGDFVIGNFTTVDPVGLNLEVSVYNSTQFSQVLAGQGPTPQWSSGALPDGRIVFSAPYTDTFFFVFTNPYPLSSHLTLIAFITTQYESNVGDEGFA
jgi:hypothetical protein